MLIFVGDIHGNWNHLIREIKRKEITDANIIICGDIGIGFKNNKSKEHRELIHWSNSLEASNNNIYCIRGNHDDPSYFDGSTHGRITLVSDWTILNLCDKNILCIGGATSIDRIQRVLGRSYWDDEGLPDMPDDLADFKNIDIVATHTCPSIYPINKMEGIVVDFCHMDQELEADLWVERQDMQDIYDIIKANNNITNWYFGHFHKNQSLKIDDILFTMCGINEMIYHN